MTTSGTYTFQPPLYDLVLHAYGRIGIRRTVLTVDHLADAAMACNLLQSEWANKQVNLWTVDLQSIPLVEGDDTYDVDAATIMIMSAYIETGTSPPQDRIITSIDRDTYASYPDKTTEGQPTVYWFQKLFPTPQITVWQPPDGNGPYTLKFYRARQVQDATIPGGINAEVPYYFLEAYVAGLSAKLAQLYAPSRLGESKALAAEAWKDATERNVEDSPWRIVPAMQSYIQGVY